MHQVLRNSSFRNVWLAGKLSTTGSQISRVGLLLYISGQEAGVTGLAGLVVLETLPGALAAPWAGALVDNLDKRSVMVAADLTRMALLLLVLMAPSLSAIYVAAALSSVAGAFFEPARSAAVPLIVEQDDLPFANAADQSLAHLPLIAGPVIGDLLFRHFGLALGLLLDASSFLVSAALVAEARIRLVQRPGLSLSAAVIAGEVLEGWRYLRRNRLALHLILLLFVALTCTGIWLPLAPDFIRTQLRAPGHMLGWQLSLFGMGTALGALAAPRLVARFGSGVTLFTAFLSEAACLSAYGAVSNAAGSMAVVLLMGAVLSVIVVPFYSILQTVVDVTVQGRVFSLVKLSESVAVMLAMTAAVTLQGSLGSPTLLILSGLAYLACTTLSSFTMGGRALLATR